MKFDPVRPGFCDIVHWRRVRSRRLLSALMFSGAGMGMLVVSCSSSAPPKEETSTLVQRQVEEEGAWEGPFCWPALGIHVMHLHTGRILSWPHTSNTPDFLEAWAWDYQPACRGHYQCPTDQPGCQTVDAACFQNVANDDSNLFCVGHAPLADGRILTVGGHTPNEFGSHTGLPDANIFDPENATWIGDDDGLDQLEFSRWYPTSTTLGDGKVVTVAGSSRACVGSGEECTSNLDCESCLEGQCQNSGAACASDVDCQTCLDGLCQSTGAACTTNLDCLPACTNGTCQDSGLACSRNVDCGPCRTVDVVASVEVFDAAAPGATAGAPPGAFTALPATADLALPIYAEMFLLPDGRLFFAGAEGPFGTLVSPLDNRALDLRTNTWNTVAMSSVSGASAAMFEPGKIIKVGGRQHDDTITQDAEIIDLTSGSGVWQPIASMAAGRLYSNLTLLPDGTVMVSGGTRTAANREYDRFCVDTNGNPGRECSPDGFPPGRPGLSCPFSGGGIESGRDNGTDVFIDGVLQPPRDTCPDGQTCTGGSGAPLWVSEVEIFDPNNPEEGWLQMAHMSTPRMYHSATVLLPDGRVASTGGGLGNGAIHDYATMEIFSPPYLSKGTRPTIIAAPEVINYGQRFTIETPDAPLIAKVSLIRLAATTHGTDQNARFVPLVFEDDGSDSIEVTGARVGGNSEPLHPNIVPPGHYMLFILNGLGVPSMARYVRVADLQRDAAVHASFVWINDRARIVANDLGTAGATILAGGATSTLRIGVEAFTGPIFARNWITLEDRSTVDGPAVSEGNIQVGMNVSHEGVFPNRHIAFKPVDLQMPLPAGEATFSVVENGQELPLLPGAYGWINVRSGGTLLLSGGDGSLYTFRKLELESGSQLGAGGKTWIFTEESGDVILRGDVFASAGRLLFGAPFASAVHIGGEFRATLVAPNAHVIGDMYTNAKILGSIFAEGFTLHQGRWLQHAPFEGVFQPACDSFADCR